MFRILPATEMGQFGLSLRFRPAYYFLRIIEAVVWGAHPYLWHAFRIAILVLAIALWWRLTAPSLGWLTAGLLCAYALTFTYWAELIGWLGPSETYAVAGLPIYIWGMVQFTKTEGSGARTSNLLAGAAVLGGGIICIGSKESFVLLAAPSLWLAYRGLRTRNTMALLAGLGSALFAGYVAASVILAVSRTGVDVYSQSVSPGDRIGRVLAALQTPQSLAPIATLILAGVALTFVILARVSGREAKRSALTAQFLLATLVVIFIYQLGFYNGAWPTGTRYDYPGLLYIPAAVFILFRLGLQLVPQAERGHATPVLRAALVIVLLGLSVSRGYGPIVQSVNANVASSAAFTSQIEHISSVLQAQPDHALVIESGSVSEFETVYSYEEFLRAYGMGNSLFLRLHGYSVATAASPQDAKLTELLTQVSAEGNSIYDTVAGFHNYGGPNLPGYSPLSQLSDFGARCYSIMLSTPTATECQTIR